MKVILHLGVHKTATTYIQSRLLNSQNALKERGVSYIGLNELRANMTSKLGGAQWSVDDIRRTVIPEFECQTLIISDENIVGGTDAPVNGRFYNTAAKRVTRALKIFSDCDVEVHITVRDFKSYMISRYSESLRHFKYRSFGNYYSELDYGTLSWYDLFDDLFDAGVDCIWATDFKSIFKDENMYFTSLLGGDFSDILEAASTGSAISRSKISQEANEVLRLVNKYYPKAAVKKVMQALDNFKQKNDPVDFNPFSINDALMLDDLYQKDLERMRSDSRIVLC